MPIDMTNIVGHFERTFYIDRERGMAIVHWEVAEGYEDYRIFPQRIRIITTAIPGDMDWG